MTDVSTFSRAYRLRVASSACMMTHRDVFVTHGRRTHTTRAFTRSACVLEGIRADIRHDDRNDDEPHDVPRPMRPHPRATKLRRDNGKAKKRP